MNLNRFAERVAGWTTLTAFSVTVDDVLWPAVILWQGAVAGGITMFFVALLCNLILIWAYDKIKKDVLALEALRELTEKEQTGWFKRLIVKFIKAGQIPAFIAISFYDPFVSVIYMRKGVESYKMEKRDWGYFALAMVIACVGWTLWWQGLISIAKVVWNLI